MVLELSNWIDTCSIQYSIVQKLREPTMVLIVIIAKKNSVLKTKNSYFLFVNVWNRVEQGENGMETTPGGAAVQNKNTVSQNSNFGHFEKLLYSTSVAQFIG